MIWIDTKLGFRMLRKHWALTLIGGAAMTAAITLGASMYDLMQAMTSRRLPLTDGDRVVILQPWNTASRTRQSTSMEDFERWRRQLQSVVDIGAFRRTERNFITGAGPAGPLSVAEMSAAGFRVARVAPRLGRFFTEDDEQPDAPPVVVIGYDRWQSLFAADPQVIGRRVQFDGTFHTVIGVMPRGFAFPVRDEYWTPLRNAGGERVTVFARLAPGAAIQRAQAEVEALGLLPAAGLNATPSPLKPRVVPYITGIRGEGNPWLARIVPVLFALLLVPPCINIAVLIYARTVARQGEFAARTALGASRSRIVTQVFIEVLVLAAAAAGVALMLTPRITRTLSYILVFGNRGFWMDFGWSYGTILFATALALFAALIAGAIPALRATRRWQLAGGLHALSRNSAPRLGKTWTAIVVAQVALSVAVVPTAAEFAWTQVRPGILGPGFEADEFFTVQLAMDARESPAAAAARFSAIRIEMVRQLTAEPGIVAVTMCEFEPFGERNVAVEVDSNRGSVGLNVVDSAFFNAFGIPLLAGRGFERGDAQAGAVIVNRSFVNRVMAGTSPLGRVVRLRNTNGPDSVYEIVGLVGDQFTQSEQATIYRPLAPVAAGPEPGDELAVRLAMHTTSPVPLNLEKRLREIAAALDPALRVDDLQSLGEIYWSLSLPEYITGWGLAAMALGIVLFSVAGIYTLMAFAVVQRRREIGIRSALGASPLRLVAGIFRTVLIPVSAGVGIGALAALLLDFYLSPVLFPAAKGGRPLPWILPAAEVFILLVGVIALLRPARQALRVDPVEMIRES